MDNQTALLWQLIATVAGVVVVVWYSLETRWLRQETKNLLKEARIQNETALRPIIDFYFHTTGVGGYQRQFLKVRNVGRGPDIFAMHKGVCYGIEVKGEKGRQSDAQKEFQVRFEAAGGVYILAKGIDEVERKVGLPSAAGGRQ